MPGLPWSSLTLVLSVLMLLKVSSEQEVIAVPVAIRAKAIIRLLLPIYFLIILFIFLPYYILELF